MKIFKPSVFLLISVLISLQIFEVSSLIQIVKKQVQHSNHQLNQHSSPDEEDNQNYDRTKHNEPRQVDTSRQYCVVYTKEFQCIGQRYCQWEVDQWKVGRCTHQICEDWKLQDQCQTHEKECKDCKPDEKKCFWNPHYVPKQVEQEMKLNKEKLPPVCHTIPNCVKLSSQSECKSGMAQQFCVYKFQRNQCHPVPDDKKIRFPPQRYPGN